MQPTLAPVWGGRTVPPYLASAVNSKLFSIIYPSILSSIPATHPSASDSVVFLRHCALYKFTYLLTLCYAVHLPAFRVLPKTTSYSSCTAHTLPMSNWLFLDFAFSTASHTISSSSSSSSSSPLSSLQTSLQLQQRDYCPPSVMYLAIVIGFLSAVGPAFLQTVGSHAISRGGASQARLTAWLTDWLTLWHDCCCCW